MVIPWPLWIPRNTDHSLLTLRRYSCHAGEACRYAGKAYPNDFQQKEQTMENTSNKQQNSSDPSTEKKATQGSDAAGHDQSNPTVQPDQQRKQA